MAKGDTVHIRIDAGLRSRLAGIATAEHRSLANLIELILIRWYEARPKQQPRPNGHEQARPPAP